MPLLTFIWPGSEVVIFSAFSSLSFNSGQQLLQVESIFSWRIFLSVHFECSMPLPSACKASVKKSASGLMSILSISSFSLAALRLFLLDILIVVRLGVGLLGSSCLEFLWDSCLDSAPLPQVIKCSPCFFR